MFRKRTFSEHSGNRRKILEFEHRLVFQKPFQNQSSKTWQTL
jgi:hypothetical protein